MTEQDRLFFLLRNHRILRFRIQNESNPEARIQIESSMVMLEEEIESLLFKS